TNNPGAVVVTGGADVKGGDFGDFKLGKSFVKDISYSVKHKGVTRTYASLDGHVRSGDTVKMRFRVMAGHRAWASLASYRAPSGGFCRSSQAAPPAAAPRFAAVHCIGIDGRTADGMDLRHLRRIRADGLGAPSRGAFRAGRPARHAGTPAQRLRLV